MLLFEIKFKAFKIDLLEFFIQTGFTCWGSFSPKQKGPDVCARFFDWILWSTYDTFFSLKASQPESVC